MSRAAASCLLTSESQSRAAAATSCISTSESPVLRLEADRAASRIPQAQLARFSGVSLRWYHSLLREPERCTPRMLARLRIAMMKLRKGGEQAFERRDVMVSMGLMFALVCREFRLDVGQARAELAGGHERVKDARWIAASNARQLAVYLLHTGTGFSQPKIAAALGLTKQAVSLAVRNVEDRREAAAFDDLCDRLLAEAGCDVMDGGAR